MAKGKPIYFIRPDREYCCGLDCIPYFYKEELKEKGIE